MDIVSTLKDFDKKNNIGSKFLAMLFESDLKHWLDVPYEQYIFIEPGYVDVEVVLNKKTGKPQYRWNNATEFTSIDWYTVRHKNPHIHLMFILPNDIVEVLWNKGGFKYFGGISKNLPQFMKEFELLA